MFGIQNCEKLERVLQRRWTMPFALAGFLAILICDQDALIPLLEVAEILFG